MSSCLNDPSFVGYLILTIVGGVVVSIKYLQLRKKKKEIEQNATS